MSSKEFLQQLSEASGVSGYEHGVRELVLKAMRPLADEIRVTSMGSLIALKRGTRGARPRPHAPKVLLEGHMDEIGLMITGIEKGFLRFTHVGGFDVRVLLGQQVTVHGRQVLDGIIGSRPPHVLSEKERNQVVPMDQLFIDVGLPEARVAELVQPGDLVTISRRMASLMNNRVAGKALDDRCAIAALVETLKRLTTMKHAWDVFIVANSQEEVGSLGAETSTFQIAPDMAIALDTTFADQPDTSEVNAVPLDCGMGIATGPNIHPLVHQRLVETAQNNQIPFQVTAYAGATGTDAWAIQVSREGIPTGLIDIPLRYMHTSVEMVSMNDIERIGLFLATFCSSLDDAFLHDLRNESDLPFGRIARRGRKAGTTGTRRTRKA